MVEADSVDSAAAAVAVVDAAGARSPVAWQRLSEAEQLAINYALSNILDHPREHHSPSSADTSVDQHVSQNSTRLSRKCADAFKTEETKPSGKMKNIKSRDRTVKVACTCSFVKFDGKGIGPLAGMSPATD